MPRCLRLLAVILVTVLPALGASPRPAASSPLVFEVSFPKELSATPVDGRVLVIISKDGKEEPRFGVGEGIESQQAVGVDVEAWQPGTAVLVDASLLAIRWKACMTCLPANTLCRQFSMFTKHFISATENLSSCRRTKAKVSIGKPSPGTS